MVSHCRTTMFEGIFIIPINAHLAGGGSFDPKGKSSWNIIFWRKNQKTKKRKPEIRTKNVSNQQDIARNQQKQQPIPRQAR